MSQFQISRLWLRHLQRSQQHGQGHPELSPHPRRTDDRSEALQSQIDATETETKHQLAKGELIHVDVSSDAYSAGSSSLYSQMRFSSCHCITTNRVDNRIKRIWI